MASLEDLVAPLRALSALLPAEGTDTGLLEVADFLCPREKEAILDFASAGERCLSKLTSSTLAELEKLSLESRVMARQQEHRVSTAAQRKKSQTVFELFDALDVNKDGLLSIDEFKTGVEKLGGGVTADDVDTMMAKLDVDKDGSLDIHEFTVWLYAEDAKNGEDAKRPAKASAPAGPTAAEFKALQTELDVKRRALERLDDEKEEESEIIHDFWRSIAKHAILTIDSKVDMTTAQWLGNGNYGFVFRAKKKPCGKKDVVVKMMGIRWAHLAAKEWQSSSLVSKHPNIVDYEDVMLHSDDCQSVQHLIERGFKSGKLKQHKKRTGFPDRYICLTQELMNQGTVQDWLDDGLLLPDGAMTVMRQVAAALAFMHENGITHNDIKPENVMLHQDEDDVIVVKLGDLGLAKKSKDHSTDIWQYGMTAFCMLTLERWGTRKFHDDIVDDLVIECRRACHKFKDSVEYDVSKALGNMPELLRSVFANEMAMEDVVHLPYLQGWSIHSDMANRVDFCSSINKRITRD